LTSSTRAQGQLKRREALTLATGLEVLILEKQNIEKIRV